MSHTPMKCTEESEQLHYRLELLERMANVGYFSYDVINNIFTCSDSFYRIFGYDPKEIVFNTMEPLYTHFLLEEVIKIKSMMQQLLESGSPFELIQPFEKNDGIKGTLHTKGERYFDTQGNPCIQGYAEDISEQVKLKEEMQRANELLMQQTKMAEMGHMLFAIAHQLKQPLQVISLISGNIEVECENGCSKLALEKSIGVIHEQLEYMNNTITDFRNYTKPELNRGKFRACECVNDVYKMIAPQLKNDEIELRIQEHQHFEVYGYRNDLLNVLMNIFSNAQEAFKSGGIKNRLIVADYEMDETYGKITIRDNAGGIDTALLPDKIFEAYVTTKGEKGTGLGLQIAKTIIEKKMHGQLSAFNVHGGAAFSLTLPLAQSSD